MRDHTEQKQMEEELRQLAAELSAASRQKDEFLATLAHELRNPLAPIRTGLELMGMAQDDPHVVEDIRQTMERQTHQLIALVDDLLDISRITRGRLVLRKSLVAMADVVQSAVEAAIPVIDAAGHTLHIELPERPMYLTADPHRLSQIISNLLNNAAKYTPAGGQIWLSAGNDDQQVVLAVKDTGIGIPADMLERIFEMFSQVESPQDSGESGLGIGLTLVKTLVEMHGGSIEVQSAGLNQGSTFTVRLPVEDVSTRKEKEQHRPFEQPTDTSHRRILVVDDNQSAASMLGLVIERLGHEVLTANDGEEAIRVAAEFRPEIMFLDIGMRQMNGYEVARHIRRQTWGQAIVLIALTGWGQDSDRQKTKEAGFDEHMVKPAEPAELRRLLARITSPRSKSAI
jgi:CheY-like chemotaxis protein